MANGIEFMRNQKRQSCQENKIFYQKSPSCSDKIRYCNTLPIDLSGKSSVKTTSQTLFGTNQCNHFINIKAAVFANIAFDNDTLYPPVHRHSKITNSSTIPGILPFARYDLEIKAKPPFVIRSSSRY